MQELSKELENDLVNRCVNAAVSDEGFTPADLTRCIQLSRTVCVSRRDLARIPLPALAGVIYGYVITRLRWPHENKNTQ